MALPVEHGGWGISLEPLVLGLLVAPSLAGAGLAVGGGHGAAARARGRRHGARVAPTARGLGFAEIAFGALTVLAVAAGQAVRQ